MSGKQLKRGPTGPGMQLRSRVRNGSSVSSTSTNSNTSDFSTASEDEVDIPLIQPSAYEGSTLAASNPERVGAAPDNSLGPYPGELHTIICNGEPRFSMADASGLAAGGGFRHATSWSGPPPTVDGDPKDSTVTRQGAARALHRAEQALVPQDPRLVSTDAPGFFGQWGFPQRSIAVGHVPANTTTTTNSNSNCAPRRHCSYGNTTTTISTITTTNSISFTALQRSSDH